MKCAFLIIATCLALAFGQDPQQNCSKPIDIVLVLDESGSIATADFTLLKKFAVDFAGAFTFGQLFTKMGAVSFDTTARLRIPMTIDKVAFQTAANALPKNGQSTCIGCGIQLGQQELGIRGRGVTAVEIVLTDGVNNINTVDFTTAINNAKAAGIILVSVGVGPGTSLPQLKQIASTINGQQLFFSQPNFAALASFVSTLVNLVCVDIPVIPISVCGNGKVEPGEQCDGGECCFNCTYSTAVCRPAAGECDVAETCSGSSVDCPADVLKPAGTACGEFFGICDVRLEKSCTGTNPRCFGPPAAPILYNNVAWEDFNVISFDGVKIHGGDVEGRLASKNSADLAGFSLGAALTIANDGPAPYSLFVAGDATWTDGSLYPDQPPSGDYRAEAFVGGTFTAPQYLQDRRSAPFTTAEAAAKFDDASTYYINLQSQLSALPTNADAEIKYTNGLFITCAAAADIYHVVIAGADFNNVDWVNLNGCKFTARWIVEITGTGNVFIKGQPFPAIVERVIYNIVGSGRVIHGDTGVAGHILAPRNSYQQVGGVSYGKVIVGNIIEARQANKPNCKQFKGVTLSTIILKGVQIGDTKIYVASLSNFVAGDLVCIQGDCRKLVAGQIADVDGDGTLDNVVTVDQAFANAIAANNFLTSAVDPQGGDTRVPWGTTPTPPQDTTDTPQGAAAQLAFAAVAVAVLAQLV